MSWGITASGQAADVVAKFQSMSSDYQNSTMPDAEKAVLNAVATDIVPKFCTGVTDPVIIEAGGSEWTGSTGLQRTLTLNFRVVPGWIPPSTPTAQADQSQAASE